ncbi:cellulose biosynthesis protein BcsP [Burkholderia sp. Ac-20353]|uniref:cellulose biosynthesis protein BcsP n=1 Tax=Burkholderia sp. Ac-20353 TaxID=2703894 RepID=UPI00197C6013|nr:cellulose biosynthesis protein BcsP [Burkholderia sp. Ac-20353]MBN3788760.1 hypothetical protein [Burkholderia sp. Ac-20353]
MSTSRDIESLFRRFGGNAEHYQEVRAEADAERARARWPLLGLVDPGENARDEQPGYAAPGDGPGRRNAVMGTIRMTHPSAERDRDAAASAETFPGPSRYRLLTVEDDRMRDKAEAPDRAPARPILSERMPVAAGTQVAGSRADASDEPFGMLKKMFGQPAAPEAACAPDPSESLDRLFSRLRGDATSGGSSDTTSWFSGRAGRS